MRLKSFVHNKWVNGARITETILPDGKRRFTATIRGWKNWQLGEHVPSEKLKDQIRAKAQDIRDRIDSGDESVFGRVD